MRFHGFIHIYIYLNFSSCLRKYTQVWLNNILLERECSQPRAICFRCLRAEELMCFFFVHILNVEQRRVSDAYSQFKTCDWHLLSENVWQRMRPHSGWTYFSLICFESVVFWYWVYSISDVHKLTPRVYERYSNYNSFVVAIPPRNGDSKPVRSWTSKV